MSTETLLLLKKKKKNKKEKENAVRVSKFYGRIQLTILSFWIKQNLFIKVSWEFLPVFLCCNYDF